MCLLNPTFLAVNAKVTHFEYLCMNIKTLSWKAVLFFGGTVILQLDFNVFESKLLWLYPSISFQFDSHECLLVVSVLFYGPNKKFYLSVKQPFLGQCDIPI